jgi:hypothetical protein
MRRVMLHITARFYEAMATRALNKYFEHKYRAEKFFHKTGGLN